MEKLLNFERYHEMVPHVKSVKIYEHNEHKNGTSTVGTAFRVGMMGMGVEYFLKFTHRPPAEKGRGRGKSNQSYKQAHVLTWTLDYARMSDFDDNVGHWQVQPHPLKDGWSRVLFATQMRLFPRVPEFVVKYVTSKALVDSTEWLKREAEKTQIAAAATAAALQQVDKKIEASSTADGTRLLSQLWKRLRGGRLVCSSIGRCCGTSSHSDRRASSSSQCIDPHSFQSTQTTSRSCERMSFPHTGRNNKVAWARNFFIRGVKRWG